MDGYKTLETLINKLVKGEKFNVSLYNRIMSHNEIPKYVKTKVKKLNAVYRGGGDQHSLKVRKPAGIPNNCGGGGCVYELVGVDDIFIKILHDKIPQEVRNGFINNISIMLMEKELTEQVQNVSNTSSHNFDHTPMEISNVASEQIDMDYTIYNRLYTQSMNDSTQLELMDHTSDPVANHKNTEDVKPNYTREYIFEKTSFTAYTIPGTGMTSTTFHTGKDVGYFLKKCTGDIEKYITQQDVSMKTHTPTLPYSFKKCVFGKITNTSHVDVITNMYTQLYTNITYLNSCGIYNGDIKFPNILFDVKSEIVNFYIHDFDDVYIAANDGFNPHPDLAVLAPTFSPLYANPVYVIFRNFVYKVNKVNNSVIIDADALKKEIVSSIDKIPNLLAGLVPEPIKPIYDLINNMRDQICGNLITRNETRTAYTTLIKILSPIDLIYLIRYSDIYSLGVSFIAKASIVQNEDLKCRMFKLGEETITKYFSGIPKSGGNLKGRNKLKSSKYAMSSRTQSPKMIKTDHLVVPSLSVQDYEMSHKNINLNVDKSVAQLFDIDIDKVANTKQKK